MIKKFLFFCSLSLILIFFSCKTDTTQIDRDTILDVALNADPDRLNPIIHIGSVARLVHQYIYLPCADFHPDTEELYPVLLEEIPSPQHITVEGEKKVLYSLKFKEDAVWDDGTPITGLDYFFTIKLIMHPDANTNAYKSYLGEIERVVVNPKNPKEFSVLFGSEYMLSLETVTTIAVLPRLIYDPEGHIDNYTLDQIRDTDFIKSETSNFSSYTQLIEDFNGLKFSREVVDNNGPYKLDSWETNKNLVISAKENYWGSNYPDNPFLQQGPEKMNFYIIPDPATALTQLKEGTLDVVNYLSSKQYVELKENPTFSEDFDFFNPVMRRYYFLGLNNADPILSDVKVREALGYLLDVDEIIKNIDYGMGKRVSSLVHPDRAYYNTEINVPDFDPEKAKNILLSKGWKDSDNDGDLDKILNGSSVDLELEMYVSQQALGRQVALMLQENAQQIGVRINITTKNSYIRDNVRNRDYGIAPLVISQDLNDDDFYNRWHSDSDTPTRRNYFSYRDSEADSLIEAIRIITNGKDRKEKYLKLQEVVYEDHPVIFLYAPMEKIVVSKRWNGSATVKRPGYMGNTFMPI